MAIEEVAPNKPRAAFVGYLTIFALIAILLTATVVVIWRAHAPKRAPYSKHPTSRLLLPFERLQRSA